MNDDIFNILKERPIHNPENVYYNPEHNQFFQVKEQTDDYFLISGLCNYYSDAMTTIQRLRVSWKFVKESKMVNCIDEFGTFDGCGWRVKNLNTRKT